MHIERLGRNKWKVGNSTFHNFNIKQVVFMARKMGASEEEIKKLESL